MTPNGIYIGSTKVPVLHCTPEVSEIASVAGIDPSNINRLNCPLGASSYSEGSFLIDAKGLANLVGAIGGTLGTKQTVSLKSGDQTASGKAITFSMYLDRIQPLRQTGESMGLFLAHMVDGRKYAASEPFTGAATHGYGVTENNLRGTYIGGSSATLNTLLTDAFAAWTFGSEINGSIDSSYLAIDWASNGSYASEPAAVVIDRVCRTAGFACNQKGTIQSFSASTLTNLAKSSPLSASFSASSGYANAVIGGGPSFLPPPGGIGAQVPSSINVLFPLAGLKGTSDGSPSSLESYSYYSVNVASPVSPSNSQYKEMVYDNFWVQGTIGNIPSAQVTAATTRANQIAAAYYRRFQMPLGRWRLKGWYFDPNWMANVAFAIVDGYPVTDIWLTAEDVSFVKTGRQRGIYANGGTIVSQASDGSTRISSSPQGTFPVLLTYGSSPGADGSATTAATWAYTIYAVGDTALANPLASNIQPTKPRDVGPRTRQAQSVANTSYSYGTAFYGVPPSSGPNTVLLWDAGETEPALCLTGGAACT